MQPQMSFEPLTPTAFLRRSAAVFGDRTAVIDGEFRCSYATFLERAERLAGALHELGATHGTRVAVLAPNTHVLLEAHYGVPLAGAVLVALNQRLTPSDLAGIVGHAEARALVYDRELEAVAREIAARVPAVKLVDDDAYERMLEAASP